MKICSDFYKQHLIFYSDIKVVFISARPVTHGGPVHDGVNMDIQGR